MLLTILEWTAFGGSLLSVWFYGRSPVWGPIAGIVVSLIFIVYGIYAAIPAAILSNLAFAYIHYRNLRKGLEMDWTRIKSRISKDFTYFQNKAHEQAVESGFWDAKEDPDKLYELVPTKLALVHSEVSEALEGHRKNLADDKLPHRSAFATELADVVIRVADLAAAHDINLGEIIAEKMEYNANRLDHRRENREKDGGKKY